MIHMVVFDMAGTTINEDNLVYKTIQHSFIQSGFDLSLDVVLEQGAGKEKRQAIEDILSIIDPSSNDNSLIDEIHYLFKDELVRAYSNAPMYLFDGLEELLAKLREEDIAIVFNTGYDRKTANFILDKVNIVEGRDIDLLVTADQVVNSRPAADMILMACDILEIEPDATIKIGDSGMDILEGKNAGVALTVGITTGAQERKNLNKFDPDVVIDSLGELWPIIDNNQL